jgi:hypothetical protein
LAWSALIAGGLMLPAAIIGMVKAESLRQSLFHRLRSHHADACRAQERAGVMLDSHAGLLAWAGELARRTGDRELSRLLLRHAFARGAAALGFFGAIALVFGLANVP